MSKKTSWKQEVLLLEGKKNGCAVKLKRLKPNYKKTLTQFQGSRHLRVNIVVDLGFPELTTDQIEQLCQAAENAARNFILSKVSKKQIEKLDIAVEAEGQKPVNVSVEIELILAPQAKGVDADAIVSQAVNKAHNATEAFLRKLK